jgi:hypothetical protein
MESDNYYTHISSAKCVQKPTHGPYQKCHVLAEALSECMVEWLTFGLTMVIFVALW